MKRQAALLATALTAVALSVPVTPASAAWNATSCQIVIFVNPSLGSDHGIVTYVNGKGDTRSREFSPEKAVSHFQKDVTGSGCTYEYVE